MRALHQRLEAGGEALEVAREAVGRAVLVVGVLGHEARGLAAVVRHEVVEHALHRHVRALAQLDADARVEDGDARPAAVAALAGRVARDEHVARVRVHVHEAAVEQ